MIKNDLARAINRSAGWRAIERGIGSTIVGSGFDPSSPVGLAFQETCEKTDKEIRLALGYADELATRFPDPVLSQRIEAWRAGVQQLESDRARIRMGQIPEAEWIADATDNIQDTFNLRDYVFAPTGQEDLVIHLNTLLGPNIATLAEFAGRERAIVGNAIASGRPPLDRIQEQSGPLPVRCRRGFPPGAAPQGTPVHGAGDAGGD